MRASETGRVMTAKMAKQQLRSLKRLPRLIREVNALWIVVQFLRDKGHADVAEELQQALSVSDGPWEPGKGASIEP